MAEKTITKSKEVAVKSVKAARQITRLQVKREGMPISLKHTHEIIEAVKGKDITKAVNLLKKVLLKEAYIPFRKYPSKGHKHGVPSGFPQKATKQVIEMLEELKSDAKNMGFDESKITISGYSLGRGGYPRFSGGNIYRHGKRTNLVIYSFIDQERKVVEKKTEKSEKTEKPEDTAGKNEEKAEENIESSEETVKEEGAVQEKNKSEDNNDLKAEK